jgi:hypothetical protein
MPYSGRQSPGTNPATLPPIRRLSTWVRTSSSSQCTLRCEVTPRNLPLSPCPDCGGLRSLKGYHDLTVKTVFGALTIEIPRLVHCACRPHETKTFSLLAELLPERTLPELLFLETKWASLLSYGMTSKLLQEVLPIDEPVTAFTLRRHVAEVAERLEQPLPGGLPSSHWILAPFSRRTLNSS